MIRALLFDPQTNQIKTGDQSLIQDWRKQTASLLWLDMENHPEEAEKTLLQQEFRLHPLAIQDAQRQRHPPKMEIFKDYVFLLLRGLDAKTTSIQFSTIQIAIFISDRFIITRRNGESRGINTAWKQAESDPGFLQQGLSHLVTQVSSLVTDRYLSVLLDLEPRLEDLEDEVVSNPRDALLEELISYKRLLKKMSRITHYHQHVFSRLAEQPTPYFDNDIKHELTDVYENLERAGSLADLYYLQASDLLDGYISVASHRLNQIMKVLTIITAIFVPLSFIAGLYGMNFDYMPELKVSYAYFMVIGFMGLVALMLLMIFRKLRWI